MTVLLQSTTAFNFPDIFTGASAAIYMPIFLWRLDFERRQSCKLDLIEPA